MTNRVREVRQALGLSQAELARKARTSPPVLCRVELGRVEPWPSLRRRLAQALNVNEEELFETCKEV